jgi:hypothetical protein
MKTKISDSTSALEWTMNDLLQLKPQRMNFDESKASCINNVECPATKIVKENNYKRPSISTFDQIHTKRLRSQENHENANINKYPSKIQVSSMPSQQQQQQQQQQSNSVLMNLLVNGCDVSAGYYTLPIPRQKAAKA